MVVAARATVTKWPHSGLGGGDRAAGAAGRAPLRLNLERAGGPGMREGDSKGERKDGREKEREGMRKGGREGGREWRRR